MHQMLCQMDSHAARFKDDRQSPRKLTRMGWNLVIFGHYELMTAVSDGRLNQLMV